MECSWRLCPMPGMYAVTSTPVVRRTRATLRSAEFGFFGVVVYTRVQTPRRWGEPLSAGVRVFVRFFERPWRTSCWIVGIYSPCLSRRGHTCPPDGGWEASEGVPRRGPGPG